jgi:predicted aminopeptidase
MQKIFWMVFVLGLLPSCYVTKQTYKQVGLFMSREPVEEVLDRKDLVSGEKSKLIFSKEVIAFARSEGLKVGSAYESYIKLPGKAVSYTVQAARPTEMKLKQWWFPFVGRVPYIGFFDESDRAKESEQLKKEGYEVYEGSATAFSSLGWFSDPIYSSMLRRSDVELAHLYFHELTHRTIWINGGVEFNENLAEFVADVLTTKFFKSKSREPELVVFDQANDDYLLFRQWLQTLRAELQKDLDASTKAPEADRIARKTKVIALAVSQKPPFKRVDFVGSAPWNNARILAAGLYAPDTAKFRTAWQCYLSRIEQANIGGFLKELQVTADKTDNGFRALDALCEQRKQGA